MVTPLPPDQPPPADTPPIVRLSCLVAKLSGQVLDLTLLVQSLQARLTLLEKDPPRARDSLPD